MAKRIITPLYILSLIGITASFILIVYLYFQPNHGGFITGSFAVLLILFGLSYLFDRYLTTKIKVKTIFCIELILLITLITLYSFYNKQNIIKLKTDKSYFIIISSDKGINIKDFKRKLIFNKEYTVENKEMIEMNSELFENQNFVIDKPKTWNGSSMSHGSHTTSPKSINYLLIENFNFKENQPKEKIDSILKKYLNHK